MDFGENQLCLDLAVVPRDLVVSREAECTSTPRRGVATAVFSRLLGSCVMSNTFVIKR